MWVTDSVTPAPITACANSEVKGSCPAVGFDDSLVGDGDDDDDTSFGISMVWSM